MRKIQCICFIILRQETMKKPIKKSDSSYIVIINKIPKKIRAKILIPCNYHIKM